MNLFSRQYDAFLKDNSPLAEKMRPQHLDDFVGQSHILSEGKMLRRAIMADRLSSIILYGPPGTGKTTLARIIAQMTKKRFETLNAVTSGIKDIKEAVKDAIQQISLYSRQTIVFIDEIHRFNKTQQDALLPYVENGTIILIGATTENPYFEVNNALLSRSMIFELKALTTEDVATILHRAIDGVLAQEAKIDLAVDEDAIQLMADYSGGDARKALNALELAVLTTNSHHIAINDARESIQNKTAYYDKSGDKHYDVASAFIKSLRGSDPDAALIWLGKMIKSGEDPKFIARRLVIAASEDVGNADPHALNVAMNCFNAVHVIGMPEGRIPLAQATVYIACAPKSNAAYEAINKTMELLNHYNPEVPNHLKDKSYQSASKLGHGLGYLYPHHYPYGYVSQNYFPLDFNGEKLYNPKHVGYEKNINRYLDFIKKLDTEEEI
jgi:putative ATPase